MLGFACIPCQKSEVQRHVITPREHGQLPDRRFQRIHVDIVGPLPPSQGMTYLFTIIDRYTRWSEAIPMSDATAASCARALMSHHIAQFGVPADITSDRGPQFTSNLLSAIKARFTLIFDHFYMQVLVLITGQKKHKRTFV